MAQHYRLSRTHYDLLQVEKPYLVEAARADAEALAHDYKSVLSLTELDTKLDFVVESAVEQSIEQIAQSSGKPVSVLKGEATTNPTAIQHLTMVRGYTSLEYQCLLNFEMSGAKVFYLAENLVDQLSETELKVPSESLEMPFPSCLFVLPSGKGMELLLNMASKTDQVLAPTDLPINVYVTLGDSSEFPESRVLVVVAYVLDAQTGERIAVFKRDLLLSPGRSIEHALNTDWNAERLKRNQQPISGLSLSIGDTQTEVDDNDTRFYTDGLQFYRLIINTLLYLMSDSAERRNMRSTQDDLLDAAQVEKKSSRKKQKEKYARKFSPRSYILLGETVGVIEDRRTEGQKAVTKERFVVRGHFKEQPYGKGRKLRKTIWIQPYFKGPEMGELVNKPYVVR